MVFSVAHKKFIQIQIDEHTKQKKQEHWWTYRISYSLQVMNDGPLAANGGSGAHHHSIYEFTQTALCCAAQNLLATLLAEK